MGYEWTYTPQRGEYIKYITFEEIALYADDLIENGCNTNNTTVNGSKNSSVDSSDRSSVNSGYGGSTQNSTVNDTNYTSKCVNLYNSGFDPPQTG